MPARAINPAAAMISACVFITGLLWLASQAVPQSRLAASHDTNVPGARFIPKESFLRRSEQPRCGARGHWKPVDCESAVRRKLDVAVIYLSGGPLGRHQGRRPHLTPKVAWRRPAH